MFTIDRIILLAASLILLGIVSSKASVRLGLPVLVLFLLVGMLAGEDGVGIAFDNPGVAHGLGTLALAMILFDGGLRTPMASIRASWKPSALLATVGVAVTAGVTGLAAAWVLELPLVEGLLLGAIVGSTDAAAVFSLLRNAGVHIQARVKSMLEIESASNDPMAIFLTVGLLEVLVNDEPLGLGLLQLFTLQMGIGAAVGLLMGRIALRIVNGIRLDSAGLYPVLVASCGLLSFGLAANLQGSGFLAIFITGVVVGNGRFVFQRGTLLFHDGVAWLSQITMFVLLGLFVNPSALLDVWLEGLIIASVLILLARPLAVGLLLGPLGYNLREMSLVSWVGLRGSVPIILAIFPLMFGLPDAPLMFNVVFFVVLISATLQGSLLPYVAHRLGLTEPAPPVPAATLEITSLNDVDGDIVKYTVGEQSRVVGRRLAETALPDGVVVAMITRGSAIIPPRGSTRLLAGDHLFVVLRPGTRAIVDHVLSDVATISSEVLPEGAVIRLKGMTTIEALSRSYGVAIDGEPTQTLDQLLRDAAGGAAVVGASRHCSGVTLVAEETVGARVTTVAVKRSASLEPGIA